MNFPKRSQRLTALVISIAAVIGCCAAAFAASFPVTYTGNGYLFEKFSHPDKDVMTPDGLVDYMGGGALADHDENQGARGQSYSWAAITYGDYLYVATNYASLTQTLNMMDSILEEHFDHEVMAAQLKALFNGTFFYGEEDGATAGGVLVKFNIHTGEMTTLMSKTLNGQSCALRNAVEYQGKLYFCGAVSADGRLGYPSVYEVDPVTDKCTRVYCGFQDAKEYYAAYQDRISVSVRGICAFEDYLVVSCVGADGPYILASNHPWDGQSAFTKIATDEKSAPVKDLFGYTAYHYDDSIYGGSIWEMASYNGSLYVALCTGTPENMPDEYTMRSFALIRGDHDPAKGPVDDPESWTWTPVVGDPADGARYCFGIDPERTRAGACNLVVYDGYLYIGEYNDEEIPLQSIIFDKDFNFMARNLTQSVNLYRLDENETMELVVGDATAMFPDGGLSGYGSGFGEHENQYIWQSTVWQGKLYLGTFDTSSLLEPLGQFVNGDLLHMSCSEWKSELGYIRTMFELMLRSDKENGPEGSIPASPEEALVLVQQAQADANQRWTTEQLLDQTNGIGREPAQAALTEEQTQTLAQALVDGSLVPGSLTDDQVQTLLEANRMLDTCTSLLDSNDVEAFAPLYEELNGTLESTNGLLGDAYRSLVNNKLLQNVKSCLICIRYLATAERGFGMYVSEDGVHFDQITNNGFGDPYNHGLRVFATTEEYMFIGTANPFMGTQIWRTRGAD